MSKNIINTQPSSTSTSTSSTTGTTSGTGGGFTAQTTITALFQKNGAAGDDRYFTIKLFKLGGVVFIGIKQLIATMTNTNSWETDDPIIPTDYLPASTTSFVFAPIAGVGPDYDVDVLGLVEITDNGFVSIYREAPPGTGVWDGSGQGWTQINGHWYV